MYRKTILNSGLRIISNAMPKMQSVAIGIWIKAGGRYESAKNKGISHYLEHLLFKGSKKYSCRRIKESIEGVGGSLNGFTSEELTCYLAKLPSRHLYLALDILADMVINPRLSKDDIDRERTVILEEIKMYKDLPQSYVHELLDELLWPNHPLGQSVAGYEESVNRITQDDLASYKKQYYIPPNIVVSAAGLLEHEKLAKSVQRIFPQFKEKQSVLFRGVQETQDKPQLKILAKDTEQTHLALGFHGFKRDHPLRHALGLLHIILGANMSSRLFNEVREKRGLAYEIGTQVKRFQDTGAFVVHAGIDNQKVSEAIKLIFVELEKIKKALVPDSEYKRAKEFYLGQLMLALEDTGDNMLWIGESTITLDKTHTLKEIIREVNRTHPEDVRQTAREILQQKHLNLSLIGPLKDKETQIYNQLNIR